MKRLPGVGGQVVRRAADGSRHSEKRRDARHGLVVEHERLAPRSPAEPDVGHFEAGCTRPGRLGDGTGDDASFRRQLVEPDLSGVTLCDGVRRQETKLSSLSQQARRPAGRNRHRIGVPLLPPAR